MQTVHKSRLLCDTINAACAMQCRCSYDNCKVWETAYAYRLLLLLLRIYSTHNHHPNTPKAPYCLNGNNIRPIHTNFRSVTSQCHTPSLAHRPHPSPSCLVTDSIARSATRRHLIYSDADFEGFRPARFTDWGKFGTEEGHPNRCNG